MTHPAVTMTKRAKPPTSVVRHVRALARTIEEGLELLEQRYTVPAHSPHVTAAPMRSLLERCEAAIAPLTSNPPLRVLLSFTESEAQAGATFVSLLPNTMIAPWRATYGTAQGDGAALFTFGSGQGSDAELERVALAAAFEAVERWQRTRGKDVVLAFPDARKAVALMKERQICAVVTAIHPLHAWLDARHRGALYPRPMRLEDFAEAYLDFLDRHATVPVVTARDIATNPVGALAKSATALNLRSGEDTGAYAAFFDIEDLWLLQNPAGVVPLGSHMKPATDEPLDTDAYRELCARLGFDPTTIEPAPSNTMAATALKSPSRRSQPLKRARVMSILPRLAAFGKLAPPIAQTLDVEDLAGFVEEAIEHPHGFYERLDALVAGLSTADGALLLIGCAAHFAALGQTNDAITLLAEAMDTMPPGARELQLLAADIHLRLKQPELALRALTFDALHGPTRLATPERNALAKRLEDGHAPKTAEHGHALLIAHITANPPAPLPRRRVLIEVGTTREHLPGQGSTEKLARACADLGLDFITVDMDPRNSRHAQRMFGRLGLPFSAITAKGEEFLTAWDGLIDYCFLDAYDFDHGKHSELRQARYENFLGSRISDAQCHDMHLRCAQALAMKLSPDGVICIDDTWRDHTGAWTAKGTTAVPFLLEAGFGIVSQKDKAALVARGTDVNHDEN